MSEPLSIVLCSKSPEISATVINVLKPEYEVIYHIKSVAAAEDVLVDLLHGHEPAKALEKSLGSKDYSHPPVAVIVGGGSNAAEFEQVQEISKNVSNIPWLLTDVKRPAPPMGPKYGPALVKRIKVTLKELTEKGEMGKDGVFLF